MMANSPCRGAKKVISQTKRESVAECLYKKRFKVSILPCLCLNLIVFIEIFLVLFNIAIQVFFNHALVCLDRFL